MSRNGGGVYSLPGTYEATPGETILAEQHNDPLEDLEQDANTARPIVAGGTGASTAAAARTALFGVSTTVDNTIARYDGVTGAIQASTASIDDSGNLTLTSTDAGAAAGPVLNLYRNSASPAASDIMGQVMFQGEDSAGNTEDYASLRADIIIPTSGAEESRITAQRKLAGATVTEYLSGLNVVPQGRITLTTALPVTTADVTAAATIYYTPYIGDVIPIYDGTALAYTTFTELSLALSSNSGHTNYHQSGKAFDCFVFNDAGTIRLGTGPAWSSDTARGTGAGTTELERYKGLRVNKVSITLRFGSSSGNTVTVDARKATYVGTFYCTANGQTEDSAINRLAWNEYHRAVRSQANYFTATRSSSSTSFTEVNSEIRLKFLDGGAYDATEFSFESPVNISAAGGNRFGFGITIDGVGTSTPTTELVPDGTGVYHTTTRRVIAPTLGVHTISIFAIVSSGTCNFRTGATATAFPTLNGIVRS